MLCNAREIVMGNRSSGSIAAAAIAAAFSPNSKYKVFWALILAGDAHRS